MWELRPQLSVREKIGKPEHDCDYNGIDWQVSSEPLGTSALKEGAV
jgi:hypothetical protein